MKSESESLFESLGLIIPSQYDFSEETLEDIAEKLRADQPLEAKYHNHELQGHPRRLVIVN